MRELTLLEETCAWFSLVWLVLYSIAICISLYGVVKHNSDKLSVALYGPKTVTLGRVQMLISLMCFVYLMVVSQYL